MASIPALKQELADARGYLDAVLDQVGDRWDTQVYSEGAAWTARQLLIHLAITDQGQSNTVTGIAAGSDPVPADFDLERYNRRSIEKRGEMTSEQARQQLNDTRAAFNAWLDTIDEAILQKRGRHATLNVYSIAEFLQVMAEHERTHAGDIARVLAIEV
jgi:hypothetical protein